MKLVWSPESLDDLVRIYDVLLSADPLVATATVRALHDAAQRLLAHPRIGERLPRFHRREVRRMPVGSYELRHEVQPEVVSILRIYSTRERR